MRIIDNIIAARIIYLLTLPFSRWDAYTDGTINDEGDVLVQPKDSFEKGNWTMLHRLVARLKKILAFAPGGKSVIASAAAAYLLVRESYETETVKALIESTDDDLMLMLKFKFDEEGMADAIHLIEETGVANVAGIPPTDSEPFSRGSKPQYKERNKKQARKYSKLGFKEYLKNGGS